MSAANRMDALRAVRAETNGGGADGVGAGVGPGEVDLAALTVKGACGVAARPDGVRPLTASLGGPMGADGAVEAAGASIHCPAPDTTGSASGVVITGGGAGPVGRPGPVSPPPRGEREAQPMRVRVVGTGDWRDRALCREVDPDLFFPVAPRGVAWREQVGEAKRVCAGCAVRPECLAWALRYLPEGVAGGLDEDERRALRRRRRTAPAAADAADLGSAPAGRRELGRALLERGELAERVALECGVSVRTVARWAAELRRAQVTGLDSSGVSR